MSTGAPDRPEDAQRIITSSVIPVQVYMLFMTYELKEFTVTEAINRFKQLHRIELKFDRMSQLLNDMVQAGNLEKEMRKKGKKNKPVAHYRFKQLY